METKTINFTDLPKKYQDYLNNETPFICADYEGYQFKIFWTRNKGTYGYQALYIILKIGEGFFGYGQTGGCGYCKKSEAISKCLKAINFECEDARNYDLFNHHIGGNYYDLNKKIR